MPLPLPLSARHGDLFGMEKDERRTRAHRRSEAKRPRTVTTTTTKTVVFRVRVRLRVASMLSARVWNVAELVEEENERKERRAALGLGLVCL